MQERRVGVTATSRQIEESRATGSAQVDSEMAAPLEFRTPTGTVATATAECGWKHGDNGAAGNRQNPIHREFGGRRAIGTKRDSALRAHEALPQTPPGGKPPETPGPLSLDSDFAERRESVKGSQAAHQSRALDRFPPFSTPSPDYQGKGAFGIRRLLASRWSALQPRLGRPETRAPWGAHEALPHTPSGGKPPETPLGRPDLTGTGLLMEAATGRKRYGQLGCTRAL